MVVRGEPQWFEKRSLLNPTVIFAILSPSTERYDRTTKLPIYLWVPSVVVVVLISQEARLVELHFKDGTVQAYREGNFQLLGAELSVERLYRKVFHT